MLMLTQYGSKVLIALLSLQHRLRLRLRGTRQYHASHGGSSVANRLVALSALASDARTLYRIWGVLPIIKWVSALASTAVSSTSSASSADAVFLLWTRR